MPLYFSYSSCTLVTVATYVLTEVDVIEVLGGLSTLRVHVCRVPCANTRTLAARRMSQEPGKDG